MRWGPPRAPSHPKHFLFVAFWVSCFDCWKVWGELPPHLTFLFGRLWFVFFLPFVVFSLRFLCGLQENTIFPSSSKSFGITRCVSCLFCCNHFWIISCYTSLSDIPFVLFLVGKTHFADCCFIKFQVFDVRNSVGGGFCWFCSSCC